MSRTTNRKGATLVLVAVSMTVLLGFAALAIDLSQTAAYKSELQRAADAGALAAAVQLTKADYETAATVASTFIAANQVFGSAPTVDSVHYGTWDNVNAIFHPICVSACTKALVGSADAIRIYVHGTGSPLFAQALGYVGFTVHAVATAWASPTIERTDCAKPIAIDYTVLTKALNVAQGRSVDEDTLRSPLSSADLAVLRDNPAVLTVCLREGAPGNGGCAGFLPANFQAINLRPGDNNADEYEANIASHCTPVGPDSILKVNADTMAAQAVRGTDVWCANFGAGPCPMKVALWQVVAPLGSRATNGDVCTKDTPGGAGWCPVVRMIGSFIVTNVGAGSVATITGYFAQSIDGGSISPGAAPGMLSRPVLVK